ncbi:hypothetical protein [Alistipes sp.]|uniref:hypothetical protein n=1 Tax=Alistipes sp. TaxID=1872444 RepID=UPI003AF05D86
MKRILLLLSGLLLAGTAPAQHITNYNTKIATIYHGKPRTLIEIAEGQGVCITEFDTAGRIVSEKLDKYDYTFNYRWTESKIVLTVCDDAGNKLNTLEMDYAEEPGRLFIDGGKMGTIEFLFNDNGTVDRIISSKNGQQGGLRALYEPDDPYRCTTFEIMVNGKVAGKATNEYTEEDEAGNPVECIQTANGTACAIHRKITYYE